MVVGKILHLNFGNVKSKAKKQLGVELHHHLSELKSKILLIDETPEEADGVSTFIV